jgi:hypothetical protein
MVVAANESFLAVGADIVLHHGRAAKLPAPNDERFVKHAPLLEVGDETGNSPIDLAALDGERFVD